MNRFVSRTFLCTNLNKISHSLTVVLFTHFSLVTSDYTRSLQLYPQRFVVGCCCCCTRTPFRQLLRLFYLLLYLGDDGSHLTGRRYGRRSSRRRRSTDGGHHAACSVRSDPESGDSTRFLAT
jgi:hypothetical protein